MWSIKCIQSVELIFEYKLRLYLQWESAIWLSQYGLRVSSKRLIKCKQCIFLKLTVNRNTKADFDKFRQTTNTLIEIEAR